MDLGVMATNGHTHIHTHTHTHTHTHIYIYIYIYKLDYLIKGDLKASFSILTTLRCM